MKKIVLSALLLATTVAFAQESKFSVSGSVDTYYSTNLSTGELGTTGILSDVDCQRIWFGNGKHHLRLRKRKRRCGS